MHSHLIEHQSAAILTQVWNVLFDGNVVGFFGFLALALGLAGVIGWVFLAGPYTRSTGERDALLDKTDLGTPSVSSLELFRHPYFYCLFVVFLVGTGAGLVVFNNIGNMVLALGGSEGEQNALVSVLSICNAVGRFGSGVVADAVSPHCSAVTLLSITLAFMGTH